MADLKVFLCDTIHSKLTNNSKQANIVVAAASRKRASEITGISVRHYATYGNVLDDDHDVAIMALAEPETVFVELPGQKNTYIRLADLEAADPGQYASTSLVALPDRTDELLGRGERHPAYGQITINRVSGESRLFMVDYPTSHFVELEIQAAEVRRSHSGERVYPREIIARIAMSQIQWSSLIASVGSTGQPCTLTGYHDTRSGEFVTPVITKNHMGDLDTLKDEIKAQAVKASMSLSEAQKVIAEMMAGGTPRKSDLVRAQKALETANRDLSQNLPFVVQQAEEAITASAARAQASAEGHIEYALARLGEKALGDRLTEALDVAAVGRAVLEAVHQPQSDEE